MARAPTTTDVFNAIAEPRRRAIVDLLAEEGEREVGAIVLALKLPQPVVSKHLAVLRRVGLVAAERRGRRKMYRVNPEELRPVHAWIKAYERFWSHQVSRVRERAERLARERSRDTHRKD